MECVECGCFINEGVICAYCQNYLDEHDDLIEEHKGEE